MNLWIYDKNFHKLQYMDGVYESFIWTPRYNEPGDFEILIPIQSKFEKNLQKDNYIEIADPDQDDSTMIIETRETTSDENGQHIKITGRSYENVLDRRIVWAKHEYKHNPASPIYIYNIINELLLDNVIDSASILGIDEADKAKRKMPILFDINKLTDKVKSYKIREDLEFYNDNMLNVIQTLCKDKHNNLGFKLRRDKETNKFNFILYKGRDLTRNNSEGNKYVMFSTRLGNLPSSVYIDSNTTLKNFTRIEYSSGDTEKILYYPPTPEERKETGIDRREMNTSPSLSESESSQISDALLQTKGKQDLMDHQITKTFEGETIDGMYVCNKDYKVGDVIEFENEFGDRDKARILEIIFSSEISGDKIYPTLESTQEDREEV